MSTDNNSLAIIASQYETHRTLFGFISTGVFEVLGPNPNRWYVRFETSTGGAGVHGVIPDGFGADVAATNVANLPLEYKFRDCPSIVAGGFKGRGNIGTTILITECIFTKG